MYNIAQKKIKYRFFFVMHQRASTIIHSLLNSELCIWFLLHFTQFSFQRGDEGHATPHPPVFILIETPPPQRPMLLHLLLNMFLFINKFIVIVKSKKPSNLKFCEIRLKDWTRACATVVMVYINTIQLILMQYNLYWYNTTYIDTIQLILIQYKLY